MVEHNTCELTQYVHIYCSLHFTVWLIFDLLTVHVYSLLCATCILQGSQLGVDLHVVEATPLDSWSTLVDFNLLPLQPSCLSHLLLT